MEQRIEEFYRSGTIGAEQGGKGLAATVARLNKEGWRVDQIVPTSLSPGTFDTTSAASGILLCSKI